ncbi:MAG: polysaccharide pyruvyl transferase family protein [Rivularia sp. (in: Bacteria)]|nr:polysaccharide pyruvyl transferase family protein [Rivularia sp. MS3]
MLEINRIQQKIVNVAYQKLIGDRRCKFNDFSKVSPENRTVNSPIMQFYSSVDNIGNYLPVLGIQKMLSQSSDTWCIHDKNIDFDFINTNYKCVIIGGAGLLHECFEEFWNKFLNECRLPTIIWGVGLCLPDSSGVRTDLVDSTKRSGVSQKVVMEVAKRCDLVNVRDNLTANYYNFKDVDISVCPTVVYVEKFKKSLYKESSQVLFSSHKELVAVSTQKRLKASLKKLVPKFAYTDNIQKPSSGIDDIISRYYCPTSILVTTRLHGAIIAYGLNVPYIAIPRDEKLRDFHRLYSNGISIENIVDLENALKQGLTNNIPMKPIAINPVLTFGEKASEWVASCCNNR